MLTSLLPILGSILDKVIPDPKAAGEAKLKAMELAQTGALAELEDEVKLSLGQVEVNKIEAESSDLFKSGWRPFIGWVCGMGLLTQFLLAPILTWVSMLMNHPITFPPLDTSVLMTLLFGMLGLGTLRTTEKLKGVK